MRKIAILHMSGFPCGGAERVTIGLTEWLVKRAYQIFIVTNHINDELLTDIERQQVCLYELPVDAKTLRQKSDAIAQFCNQNSIEILINQGFCFGDIAYLRKKLMCKMIYCNHSVPLWEIRQKTYDLLLNRHTFYGNLRYLFKKMCVKRKIYRRYVRMYQNADKYVVLCEPYRQDMIHLLPDSLSPDKLCVICNSIPAHYPFSTDKRKQLLFLGRLDNSSKCIDKLLKIWAQIEPRFTDWQLLIVGDGDDREMLETLAGKLHLQHICFCGWSNHPDRYLNTAAILCLTSAWEGWGLVLAQAQQAGVVPIAYNSTAGSADILSPNGVNGILVENNHEQQYVMELEHLMRDDTYRTGIQRNIIIKAKDYDINNGIGQQWLDLFNELLHTP